MVVVLSQRDKLAMEGDFRRLLPPAARFGTTFVFRQARGCQLLGAKPSCARSCTCLWAAHAIRARLLTVAVAPGCGSKSRVLKCYRQA